MRKTLLAALLPLAFVSSAALAHDHNHDHGGHDGHHSAADAQAIANAPLSDALSVSGCWIRSLPAPAPSAGYFVVSNSADTAVNLVAAASPAYGMVMLHQTTHDDGMSRMSMAETIDIPAGGELEFKPGGYHAMLEKAHEPIAVGSTVAMDFLFDNGSKASAQCEVKAANTMAH